MKLVFFGKEKIIQKVSIVLLLCRYFKRDGAKYKCLYQMWRCTVFWRDFHNQLFFRREIQIPHLLENSKSVNCCCAVTTLQPNTNVFIRCDSAQWEIFGKRQNCRRWIRFFGQIWDEAARCTLGDYWRFGSRLIDMTQCLHSGIPTLMTTSIWRDFSHLTPVWT